MPNNLDIRRTILKLTKEATLLQDIQKPSHNLENLRGVALQELAKLRCQFAEEIQHFLATGRLGTLVKLLPHNQLHSIAEQFGAPVSEKSSPYETPESDDDDTSILSTFNGQYSTFSKPINIPKLDIQQRQTPPNTNNFEKIKEFRNIIEVVTIPKDEYNFKTQSEPNITRCLSGSPESTISTSTTDFEKRTMKKQKKFIPSQPLISKRDEEVQCSFKCSKADIATSPIQNNVENDFTPLSDYSRNFEENFMSNPPSSSDPSIGQVLLEPEEISSRKIISVRPDGSIAQTDVGSVNEAQNIEVENALSVSEDEMSSSISQRAPRMLRLDFIDVSSSGRDTSSDVDFSAKRC